MRQTSIWLFVCAFSMLTSKVQAQQHSDWPLCGIVAIDSLRNVQSVVRIQAWRNQLLSKAGASLTDTLEAALKGTVSRLTASPESGANPPRHQTLKKGTLWLELGVGRPRDRVRAIGGNWILLVDADSSTSEHISTIGWQQTGPLYVVPVDSLIERVRSEALRLIEDLPARLQRCRQIRDMPSDIRPVRRRG
jgi:hypothetical protein